MFTRTKDLAEEARRDLSRAIALLAKEQVDMAELNKAVRSANSKLVSIKYPRWRG